MLPWNTWERNTHIAIFYLMFNKKEESLDLETKHQSLSGTVTYSSFVNNINLTLY